MKTNNNFYLNRLHVAVFILLSVNVLFTVNCLAFDKETIQNKIDTLIQGELPDAHVSVMVKDTQGNILYKRDSNKFMYPASSTKLFTATAALYKLGSNFHFSTRLSRLGGNYYIQFLGDPSFTTDKLEKLISSIKKSDPKIKKIILDTSYFEAPYYAAGTSYDDLGFYYAAPSTALMLNQNSVIYDLITSKKINGPVRISLKSQDTPILIKNTLVTKSLVEAKKFCSVNVKISENNHLKLFGCVAQKDKSDEIKLAITDPVSYAKKIILDTLRKNKISFRGKIYQGVTPSRAKLISINNSEDLPILIKHMLEESDNLYADALTKTLGKSISMSGSYKDGAFAIKEILSKSTSININKVKLADGFGSRYDMSTAEEFVNILSDLYRDKDINPIILNSLPRMGVSGTLKKRMIESELKNHVIAKTGSFQDSSSLSGYLIRPDSKVLIFSIISNQVYDDINKAKSLEEKILEILFKNPI